MFVGSLRAVVNLRLLVLASAALVGAVLCSTMVWRTSSALFAGTTTNTSNSWATGTVSLSDDAAGTALFSSATDGGLSGGQSITKCIKVTYGGSITSGTS